jgi:hypothetical protein
MEFAWNGGVHPTWVNLSGGRGEEIVARACYRDQEKNSRDAKS